ncbi:MAG: response regulator transcription factor [Neptuniibacter sp.]|jgi:DNA-binding response OmpR family regulator|uniref:response regulator transcription factor n=1 Tax=Neptuniibacter sp. TaxID=1962643 RepID=UPI003B5B790F
MEYKRILIIEDQEEIAQILQLHLSDLGAVVEHARDGHEGLYKSMNDDWDMIIMDIQLPGPSGLEICRKLRKEHYYTPILLLTSRATELDRVLGLDLGADDYITKPFSIMELIARIKAVFRREAALREKNIPTSEQITVGSLVVDDALHQVELNGKEVDLTSREFSLLKYFAKHPGRVFKRSELLDNVWGYGHEGYEHTVNSHINRLRSKIETDPNNPEIIVTVWGVGYKLEEKTLSA